MAKDTGVNSDLFKKTEGEDQEIERTEEEKKVNPKGVGLMQWEWDEIERIAEDLGVTGHALAKFFLRYAVKQYKEGKVKIPTKKETKIDF
jgi:hypothetical protein